MKIQVLSDLHLEFGSTDIDFSNVDVIVLAGDILTGTKGFEWIRQQVSKTPVIYIPGNHEYYRSSYPKLLNRLREASAGTNVHVLECASISIDSIRFHGTTLWTNFELFGDPKVAGPICQQKMNDYRLIRKDPSYSKLRSLDTHLMHYRSLKWLKDSLLTSDATCNVVVTHHAPSPQSLPQGFRNDILSAAYASNLEEFIQETRPDLWIHGHVHEPFDYRIEHTRIICNPHGYIHQPYNGFDQKLVLEVGRPLEP